MRQFRFYAARLRFFPFAVSVERRNRPFPEDQSGGKKVQRPCILMFFVSSLWCEINRVGGVSRNYYWSRSQEMKSLQQKHCLQWPANGREC